MRILLSAAIFLAVPAVQAQERVSSVRLAAIERMEKKLGTMRGTLRKNDDKAVLTRKMVERFKPLKKGELFHERLAALEEAEKPPTPLVELSGDGALADVVLSEGVTMSEIYEVAGIDPPEAEPRLAGGEPDMPDLDALIASVDAMIAASR